MKEAGADNICSPIDVQVLILQIFAVTGVLEPPSV